MRLDMWAKIMIVLNLAKISVQIKKQLHLSPFVKTNNGEHNTYTQFTNLIYPHFANCPLQNTELYIYLYR